MTLKNLSAAVSLCLCFSAVRAQEPAPEPIVKTIEVAVGKDAAFERTIDYLQENDYFILCVDRSAGFIQAKTFIENPKKLFSVKLGERRTLDFMIRPKEGDSLIRLDIYREIQQYGGDNDAPTIYYKELGISRDPSLYREVLEGLQKALE